MANSSLNSEGKEVHINIITTEEASLEDSIKEAGIEVESNSQNGFVKMVTQQKYMVIIAFLPFLNIQEMARFYRLNNACEELMFKINFKILFEAQGIKLRPDLIEALNTSPSLALLAGLKALK